MDEPALRRQAEARLAEMAEQGDAETDWILDEALPILYAPCGAKTAAELLDSGARAYPVLDAAGAVRQLVYAGEDLGGPHMRRGYGGEVPRLARELAFAEREGLMPCALLNIGTTSACLCLVAADAEGTRSLVWYDSPGQALLASYEGDAALPLPEQDVYTPFLDDFSDFFAGFARYCAALETHGTVYTGLQWVE